MDGVDMTFTDPKEVTMHVKPLSRVG